MEALPTGSKRLLLKISKELKLTATQQDHRLGTSRSAGLRMDSYKLSGKKGGMTPKKDTVKLLPC